MKKVQTIKNPEKLQEIQEGLSAETDAHGRRMYLFFMCGIYTGLRVSDLVRLKAGHVRGEEIILTEEDGQGTNHPDCDRSSEGCRRPNAGNVG